MEEEKIYYVCAFIEGREKTIELPPRKGPFTYDEAEALRKRLSSVRYHRKLRYKVLNGIENKLVK